MRPAMTHIEAAYADWQNNRDVPAELSAAQDQAFARAQAHGLPWRKDEHWKYTSLFSLAKLPLTVSAEAPQQSDAHVPRIYAQDDAWSITLYDGHLVAQNLPDGVQLTLSHAPNNREVARHSVMQELNHAFAGGTVELSVKDNTELDKALYVRLINSDATQLSSPRVHVNVGRSASITLIEHIGSGRRGDAGNHVCNSFLTMDIGDNAQVQHTRVQEAATGAWEFFNTDVTVGRDATYASLVIDAGAGTARHDMAIALNGNGAQCSQHGVFMPAANQHMDHHTLVHHNVAHTNSEQVYHGVAASGGHGVFNGKVLVRQDAQKIVALQSNQNILLGERAVIDTKPELEIYADDVKCSHGATVGQLDDTALFYLQSRGIDPETARLLLVEGFVQAIYAPRCDATLREYLDKTLANQLERLINAPHMESSAQRTS